MPHSIQLTAATLAVTNVIMVGSAVREPVWGFRICELTALATMPCTRSLIAWSKRSGPQHAAKPHIASIALGRRFYEMTAVGHIELAGAIIARPRIGKVLGRLAWSGRSPA